MKHENNGSCERCLSIKNRYQGFHEDLWQWFKALQMSHPEVHISCAGRDEDEQNQLYYRKATKALWSYSAHNWNCALDLFVIDGSQDIYPKSWFYGVLEPYIPHWIEWYGKPKSPFYELPHIELKGWRDLATDGKLKLVE